jgi:hypothetical protein
VSSEPRCSCCGPAAARKTAAAASAPLPAPPSAQRLLPGPRDDGRNRLAAAGRGRAGPVPPWRSTQESRIQKPEGAQRLLGTEDYRRDEPPRQDDSRRAAALFRPRRGGPRPLYWRGGRATARRRGVSSWPDVEERNSRAHGESKARPAGLAHAQEPPPRPDPSPRGWLISGGGRGCDSSTAFPKSRPFGRATRRRRAPSAHRSRSVRCAARRPGRLAVQDSGLRSPALSLSLSLRPHGGC